jgi:Carboxypeptidase regulatory-like domain
MKKFPALGVLRSMRYYKVISRTLLAMIVVCCLTGALVAERRWTRDRDQSSAAAQQKRLNQSTAREANFSFRDIRETAPADNRFTYRNLVSLPDRRPSRTAEPIISLDRTVESAEPGEFTLTANADEPADEETGLSRLTPRLRTAPIPAAAAAPGATMNGERDQDRAERQQQAEQIRNEGDRRNRRPREERLTKAHDFNGDVRKLPRTRPTRRERRELEGPPMNPGFYVPPGGATPQTQQQEGPSITPQVSAPAPAPTHLFEGLDRFNWGAGSPPDTNGDVGPNHYIQTVNTSIGIYRKTDGLQLAAFTFDTFMSQGNFGNLCDNHNFGDPVVLYDTFEDRWIITDFAFVLDSNNNVQGPAYQCIAASKTGDPVSGGWSFYSRQMSDSLGDYPKFGIWPDGLYMTANMFSFGANSTYQNARAYAFNKAQMYAGSPTVKIVSFDIGGGDFTILPSNARLQTGTPPAGRPNLFISTQLFLNALTVYKFHVDWNNLFLSTFTGPDTPSAATSWPNNSVANAPQPGTAALLDVLQIRGMVQNQYTNFGGTESLWVPHTVRRVDTSGAAAPRWYQVNVTGGTIAASLPQAATWDPDGDNNNHRYMPSLALDRAGNLAMGYSISNATSLFPSMMYAGRLAGDPVNTFSQTEQLFFQGTASQTGTTRWGDYSAMTLDPNGCTFWYTSEYANPLSQASNQRWLTKFGSIGAFPGCTPVGAGGTISGTVTSSVGGSPMTGATVMLGARSTTTDGSGNYSFNIPAGTYPSITASQPGFGTGSAATIVVTDGNITTQNFALTPAATSSCPTDTTQADFQTGVSTNLDLNVSPGNVLLSNADKLDQQNATLGAFGVGITTTTFGGQTFTPSLSGSLTKVDINLFCSGCTGTVPNLTLSVRATAAGLPTGPDLASAAITGFNNGSAVFYTAMFGVPLAVTAGTQYALVIRPTADPSAGTYALTRSGAAAVGADVYAGGDRVASADSGAIWSIPLTGGVSTDAGFRIYINNGYSASGDLVSAPKDSNALSGSTAIWQTLSWSGSAPANTSISFQVAGSNNVNGPYNFVGPDGTAGTFFTTSPAQLSPQFYNLRYRNIGRFLARRTRPTRPRLTT